MSTRTEKARLLRLQKFYAIKGDGVAQLRLRDAASEPRFKLAIKKLSDLTLDQDAERSVRAPEKESLA